MPKLTITIAISLVAGFAAAALIINAPDPVESVVTGFDSTADVNERLRALESAVNVERQARQLLEEEFLILYEELESLENSQQPDDARLAAAVPLEGEADARALRAARESARGSGLNDTERRIARLTEAGFSEARADWIIQRESELRMDALRARYDSMRSGEPINRMNFGANSEFMLREELGDPQYEMYLQASNRPTAVGIGTVFESSPAQTAGLLPGDQITHYDGTRIFSTFDLTRQAMQGNAGENVVLNITREGIPMQLVIPRGPLGINAGRGR